MSVDVKVSGLPPDSSLDGNHYTILNDPTGPTTKRTLLSTLAAWFFDQLNIPTATGSPVVRANDFGKGFVLSGMIWSGDAYASTRNASMTSGFVYIAGKKLTAAAVSARAFTASKDTYVDAKDNGDGTALLIYTEVTNNAASPSTLSNGDTFTQGVHVRIGTVVTGASNIAASTSIGQGGYANTLPTISSQILKGFDSLGNIIYPKGPTTPALEQNPIFFSVYRVAALNTPNGGAAAIAYDTKEWDKGNNVDVTTNKGRFTAPIAGYYSFTGYFGRVNSAVDSIVSINKNGAELKRLERNNDASFHNMGGTVQLQLKATDYIEILCYTGSTTAMQVANIEAWFSGYLISAS